jgi:predicted RNA-binding Zn-ribbon protein involved in translation (DUF1610 family)
METKIEEPTIPCISPEHNPAMYLYRTPGKYKHVCPNCGKVTIFEVPLVI